MMSAMNVQQSSGAAWNGPVCPTCDKPYLGVHSCSPVDLLAKADRLRELALRRFAEMQPQPTVGPPSDRTAGCPCRPENGGSGVCGCILGGPQVTC